MFNLKTDKIVNKFLVEGDKFKPELHLEQPRFTYSACSPLLKTKKETILKNLKKQQIEDIFIKKSQTKPDFSMMQLMEILEN